MDREQFSVPFHTELSVAFCTRAHLKHSCLCQPVSKGVHVVISQTFHCNCTTPYQCLLDDYFTKVFYLVLRKAVGEIVPCGLQICRSLNWTMSILFRLATLEDYHLHSE